jgi:alpha-glucoside transport system substrate-binding protein
MSRPLRGRFLRLLVSLSLVAAACGCSGPADGGTVSILVAWGGTELKAFDAVIDTFEQRTGISVDVESTRALDQELGGDLQEGDPPDVAALPSIGSISQYASDGALKPLNGLIDPADYGPPWSDLMRPINSRLYTVPVKADVKSLIWYDPAMFPNQSKLPTTWAKLLAFDRFVEGTGGSPWCLAVSSTSTSGWPGTDWIADILLSRYGPGTYQRWVSGELPWTSGPVENAWLMWGQLIGGQHAVYRGLGGALGTGVGDVYPRPGGCYLQHGTLVDEGFPTGKRGEPILGGTAFGSFPFPALGASTAGAIQVSADFMGLFRDTTQARALIRYLTSTPAQKEWVGYAGADGFSPDNQVPVSAYPNPATKKIAAMLTSGKRELCFGASDAMSPDLSVAFDQAILEYLADPSALTTRILPELAQVPSASGTPPTVCGMPGRGAVISRSTNPLG